MTSLGFLNEALLDGTWSGEITKRFVAVGTPGLAQVGAPTPVELRVSAHLNSVTIVPLPGAVLLFGSCLLGSLYWARTRRR